MPNVLCAKIQQWTNVPVPCAHTLLEDMDYTSINVSDQSLEEKEQHKEDNDVSEVSKDFSDKVVSPLNLRIRKPVMQVSGERSENRAKALSGNVLA